MAQQQQQQNERTKHNLPGGDFISLACHAVASTKEHQQVTP